MKANQLLYWMSHLGDGTWESFKNAVGELAEPDEKQEDKLQDLVRRTRFRFSDIGSVDFSTEKRRRWQVIEPLLASFAEKPESAILCGGRSPALVDQLQSAANANQCKFESGPRLSLPDNIVLTASADLLNRIAFSCRINRSIDFADETIRRFVPISAQLARAASGDTMIGWKRQYFDLHSKQWTAAPVLRSVCECISQYGRRMTFLQVSRKKIVVMPRREAIYAAAMLAGVPIVSYDDTGVFRVPMHAALPEAFARLMCISSGNIGTIEDGTVCYSPVPHRIARLVMASLGQTCA
jgi:hypothetical protein